MLPRVAVIIIKDGDILLINRFKEGKSYYVIPGGSVKKGETVKEAAVREIREETNLDISIGRKLWEFKNERRVEYYFLVEKLSGDLRLGSPEINRQSDENIYHLEWVSLEKINETELFPESVRDKILNFFS